MKKQNNIMRQGKILSLALALIILMACTISALSYSPGIRVYDEASWVGLGFSEDTPAITRSVVGEVDDSIDGWLYNSTNGQDGTNQDNYFSPFGRLVANDSNDFNTLSWSLLKIEHDDASDGITQWNITTTDGTKYVFDKVVYITTYNFSEKVEKNETGDFETEYKNLDSPLEGKTYTYAWYLTEVYGLDYVDNSPAGMGTEDYGYWQKINYQTQDLEYRFPSSNDSSDYFYYDWKQNDTGEYYYYRLYEYNITFAYPENILTRLLNITYLTANDRTDAQDKNGNSPYRLSEIETRRIGDSQIISKIKFGYDYSLASGKLTLKNVTVIGINGGELPPTIYEYAYNPEHNKYAYDYWGYFNNQTSNTNTYSDNHDVDSASVMAWTLTKIKLPEGGEINYEYESNSYEYEQNVSLGGSISGAGIRLKEINTSDGIGQTVTTSDEYGAGVVNHVVNKSSRRLDNSALAYLPEAYIEYENITTDYGDYGRIVSYYVTSKDEPDTSLDYSYKRGIAEKTEVINESEDVTTWSELGYSYNDKGNYTNSKYQSGIVLVNNSTSSRYGLNFTTKYYYNSEHLVNKTEYYDLITTYEYAYESDCPSFVNNNRYNVVTKTKLHTNNVSDADMKGYSRLVFDDCGIYSNYSEIWYDVDEDGYDASPDRFIIVSNYTSYDNYGNILTTKDALGNQFDIRYDSTYHAYPIKGWNEEYGSESSPAWQVAYNNRGLVANTTGANGEVISYVYDEFDRILNVTYPGDSLPSEMYEYYFADSLSVSDLNKITEKIRTSENNFMTGITYSDGIGRFRESLIENSNEDAIDLVKYDNTRGLIDKSFVTFKNNDYFYVNNTPQDVGKTEAKFDSDPLMTLSLLDSPGLENSSIAYGSEGEYLIVEATDERNNTGKSYIDKYGRIIRTTDISGNSTLYEYDIAGNLIKLTDEEGINWTYEYDNLGRMIEMFHPDFGTSYYGYDDNFNLVNYTDNKGTISYTYDKLDRIISIDYSLTSDINYTYDAYDISAPVDFNYPKGKLTKIQDNSTITYYFYDEKDQLRIINVTILEQGGNNFDLIGEENYELRYDYDYTGGVINFTDHNGNLTVYTYNDLGEITNIKYAGEDFANYTYRDFGAIEKFIIFSIEVFNLFDTYERLAGIDILDVANVSFFTKYFDYKRDYASEQEWEETDKQEEYIGVSYPTDGTGTRNISLDRKNRKSMNETCSEPYVGCLPKSIDYNEAGKPEKITENETEYSIEYYEGTSERVQSSGKYNFTYDYNNSTEGMIKEIINATSGEVIMQADWDDSDNLLWLNSSQFGDIHYTKGEVYYYYNNGGNLVKKIELNVQECSECSIYNRTIIYYYDGDAVIGEKQVRTA